MSAEPSSDQQFEDMARRLSSLYREESAPEEADGAIYSELRNVGDRYTGAEELALGGMKKICRVFDTKTGRHVAMAELRADTPRELYEPFLREARLTALLEHPNIISVQDIGLFADGRPFFTMDLKRGDSLGEMLKKNKMPRDRLLEIFIKLCDAISYAHSRKVLHLDLKPENIQVGRFGEVFICDWGLGKIADSDESEGQEFDEILFNPDLLNNMTLSGELKGTPGYMAPEQFEKGGVKTYQTDVYALGCLLHALLTGRPPLTGDPERIRASTLAGKIVSPAAAFPGKSVPKGLNAVVMKALALKPANRYASVAELRDDVKNFLSGFSTSAENAGFIKEASLFYKRNRAACLVGLGAVAVVVATTALFIKELQDSIVAARRSHALAETRRQEAEASSARYRDELTRNMRLMSSFSGDLKVESRELSRSLIYSDPILALDLSIQRLGFLLTEDDPKNVSSQLGYTYFIRQDFPNACAYIDPENPAFRDLFHVGRNFAVLKTGDLLTPAQLIELFGELSRQRKDRKPLMEKMLAYDAAARTDQSEYGRVVRAVLAGWNKRWTQGRFEYDAANKALLVRGGQLTEWAISSEETSGETPLRFLEIESIDARGTGLRDLNQIKTLPVQELDIRDTKVADLTPIHQFTSLRRLIVSRGQFSARQLANLPKSIKLQTL